MELLAGHLLPADRQGCRVELLYAVADGFVPFPRAVPFGPLERGVVLDARNKNEMAFELD